MADRKTMASRPVQSDVDFKMLERAAECLHDKMRFDEAHPDLYSQFTFRADSIGGQNYYIEPYKTFWGPMVEYAGFIPLPRKIADQYGSIECASFMGIIPEIERVWVTVDKRLYLWNYRVPDDVVVYDGVSEVIVSVCVCAPRTDVFIDSIRYVLAVASTTEVSLLAISCSDNCQDLKVIPTAYTMPTDNVTMVRMVGSQLGRIFMAGNDSNIYELDYGNAQGSWASAMLGIGAETRHKCRKVNHFAWNWKLVHVLPPFLRSLAGEEDAFVDLLMDDVRNVCYAITKRGFLSALFFGADGRQTQLFLNSLPTFEAAKMHVRSFPRDSSPKAENFTSSSSAGFEVSSIHAIPLTESKKVQLLIVLKNGIRIFMALLHSSDSEHFPVDMRVVYVRSPPPPAALKASARSKTSVLSAAGQRFLGDADWQTAPLDPIIPQYLPAQSIDVGPSLYSEGVLLAAVHREQRPDEVACFFEDLAGRTNLTMGFSASYQPPSMREGMCLPIEEKENQGRIFDIKESCSPVRVKAAAAVATLFAQSMLPATNSMIDDKFQLPWCSGSGAKPADIISSWFSTSIDQISPTPVPLWGGSSFIGMHTAAATRDTAFGYDARNLRNVALLGELSRQHAPAATVSLRRHFLVLSNQGLHLLEKLRPADILYRQISHLQENSDQRCKEFFSFFGELQASAMCVALACGVPFNAGVYSSLSDLIGGGDDMSTMSVVSATTGTTLDVIQVRAMNLMLAMTQSARFTGVNVGSLGASSAIQDSRLVLSGSSHQFIHSTAHDALYQFASRTLRPIWLRPILSPEGKSIATAWLLLIPQVRAPLLQLQKVVRGFFTAAVVSDPHQVDFIAAMANNMSDDSLTHQMLLRAQNSSSASTDRMLSQLAKNVENASLSALYRSISRSVQALALLEVLSTVQSRHKIRLSWSRLAAVSFRTLVVSAKAHETIKKTINEVLEQLRSLKALVAADELIGWLSADCFHFFSIGDRCAFEAACLLDELVALLQTSDQIGAQQMQQLRAGSLRCISLMLRAAKCWNSYELVHGDQSQLSKCCADLLKLGRAGRLGAVDLCIAAAANFSTLPEESQNRTALATSGSSITRSANKRIASLRSVSDLDLVEDEGAEATSLMNWEQLMYHSANFKTEQERISCLTACYSCLVSVITSAGALQNSLGAGLLEFEDAIRVGAVPLISEEAQIRTMQCMKEMATKALQSCSDPVFHELLGDRLLSKQEHTDLLLAIDSPHVEDYLKSRDADLCYSYFQTHAQHANAARWMDGLARAEENNLSIDSRIAYLRKAVASAEKCLSEGDRGATFAVTSGTSAAPVISPEYLQDIRDALEIAEHQSRIFFMLQDDIKKYEHAALDDAQRRQLEQLKKTALRCQSSLMSITDLFYEICQPYKLWEMCLLILNVSRHEDEQLVGRLWRSSIYRIVPEESESEQAEAFLRVKRDPNRLESDKRRQRRDVKFEDSDLWLPVLCEHVTELGRQLRASETLSTAFPIGLVLEELEEIAATLTLMSPGAPESSAGGLQFVRNRGWTSRCMKDVGFTFSALLETYMELFDRWAGKSPEKLLQLLSSSSYSIMKWCTLVAQKSSSTHANTTTETRQFIQSVRSGRMSQWLEKLRRHASTLSSRPTTPTFRALLRHVSDEVAETNRRVHELSNA